MKVLKFGGTSVGNAQNISQTLHIVQQKARQDQVVVAVSAMSGVTDMLLHAGKLAASKNESFRQVLHDLETKHFDAIRALLPITDQNSVLSHCKRNLNALETLLEGCFLLGEMTPRTSDSIVSYGELLSSFIVAKALEKSLPECGFKDSRELIVTNHHFGHAAVDFDATNKQIRAFFNQNQQRVTIVPGFIAATPDGQTTTLGRGGSDYTAAIFAAALHAAELEIWTDVNGMFTANPKIVKQAQAIEKISYEEAMELSHFGAKVLYPPTIQPVLSKNIPIWIKNTFEPEAVGTYISTESSASDNPIRGISHIDKIALITLEGSGMIGVAGSSKRLFEVLSQIQVNVIFITQASSEHSICIGVLEQDAVQSKPAIDKAFELEISQQKVLPCTVETDLCIVAVVGEQMKNHQGISGKMFSALGYNNVNIRAIAQGASERNISIVIDKKDVHKALNTLHEKFFEDNTKQLNLYVMGVGNVGKKFLDQVRQQQEYLLQHYKLNLRVVGLSNSKTMVFNEEGIDLSDWEQMLEQEQPLDYDQFIRTLNQYNLRNSIFVDITASDTVAALYAQFLQHNIAVVTCNKIACASEYGNYRHLKHLSRKYNAPFLFETNVGAGLPIIDTLKNLVASGDKVHEIQAVLSGSLNFIFNHYTGENTFAEVVRQAGVEGYTEPDPTIDLSGVDVMRKILILIRESGYVMELNDIDNQSFLPEACLKTRSVDAFFESLVAHESHFKNLVQTAREKQCKLKYVATFKDGKAAVGLQQIPSDHPFYNLEGKDNIVLFFTDRYVDQPLLIKGAGAGAAVTASGIFADVIRMGNL
jgi:aspartokinase/homoserine dehydrogenase 1